MAQAHENTDKPPSTDGRVARGEATRTRVLDAAERLFGETGFDAVSIRDISQEAGVTLGVVGFHGGSKRDLFRTVIARRAETLYQLRAEALAALQARGDITLEDLIDAYITPYLETASRGDPQWRAYAQLIARQVSDERNYTDVRELYDPMARKYLDEMSKVCPEADHQALVIALTLTVSSMLSIVASHLRIVGLSDTPPPETPIGFRRVLIDFCVGGMQRAIGQ